MLLPRPRFAPVCCRAVRSCQRFPFTIFAAACFFTAPGSFTAAFFAAGFLAAAFFVAGFFAAGRAVAVAASFGPRPRPMSDRRSDVKGTGVSVRVDIGGRAVYQKKTNMNMVKAR